MPKSKNPPKPDALPLIIGIGSSAGGLEAIRELATNLPPDTGCSYVIVQHMSPQHKSLMTGLIASETKLKVVDITDGETPQPDVIYVTPPRHDVLIEHGKLRLVDPSQHPAKPKPSVDRFLKSLAVDRGSKTMAIILSGTGSDGSYGIQAIREAGGITIAQDDVSAKYDGMSNSAIETGCIDLVLRPSQIGTHLKKIMTSAGNLDQFRDGSDMTSPLSGILQIVLARTRVDFRDYKQTTVQRRIERRMVALGIATSEEYVSHCRNNPNEVDALFKDLLISVTRFFRDKDEFEELSGHVNKMVAKTDKPLRIWVAGCATGEEVYSIAILLAEAFGGPAELLRSRIQIFATDIDRAALNYARQGKYPLGALDDVPQHLAEKYFIQESDGVRVIEALRSVMLFSDHNLCQDPPFLNMDLICCRNLLIYFGPKLQSKVLSRLHYAMKQKAILFLGTAESVSGAEQLFVPAGKNAHIFRKRQIRPSDQYDSSTFSGTWPTRTLTAAKRQQDITTATTDRLMFDGLARALGTNSVLVTAGHSFLRVYGDISRYVDLSETTKLNLQLSLLVSPYREEARSLVTLALKHNERRLGIKHMTPEGQVVQLEVVPIAADDTDEQVALLIINDFLPEDTQTRIAGGDENSGAAFSPEQLRELDRELASTREALQQTIEELETSNEELQALNEEMQSTNEELQATNEELETSNEELQSTNEELITVNEELQVNASETMALNAELGSVLGNIPLPLIVLDNALQVSRASKSAMAMFEIPTPLKTPHISQISLPDGFPRLVEICNRALQFGDGVTVDFEVNTDAYSMQCAPFSGETGQLLGVTIVFLKSSIAQALSNEMKKVLENAPIHLIRYLTTGEVIRISKETAKALGVEQSDAIGKNVTSLLKMSTDARAPNSNLELLARSPGRMLLSLRKDKNAPPAWISAEKFLHFDTISGNESIVIAGSDVTKIVETEQLLRAQNRSLELVQDIMRVGHWRFDLVGNTLFWSDVVYDIHGIDQDDYTPSVESSINLYHPDDRELVSNSVSSAIADKTGFEFKCRLIHSSGRSIWVEAHGSVLLDDAGEVQSLLGVFREITQEVTTNRLLDEITSLQSEFDIGFFSYDSITETSFWSNNVNSVLGLPADSVGDFDTFASCLEPAEKKRFLRLKSDAFETGKPINEEFKTNSKTATKGPPAVSMQLRPSIDADGKLQSYYGTIHWPQKA
jgi:two-component system CheB/CheR fusion protein